MQPETLEKLCTLRGLVATCITTGTVEAAYAAAHEELRAWNITNGFTNVEYRQFPCVLVESGRDEVAAHTLRENYDFVLQIDADAAPFAPDSLARLLHTAFVTHTDADVVGAYCQLKQPPYLPTIDTGSGTWEERYPNEGVLPAIRTGGHFLLQKRSAFQRFGPPWHRTYLAAAPLGVLRDFDALARQRHSGRNPWRDAEPALWEELREQLIAEAAANGHAGDIAPIGEDSGFCDRLLAAGGKLYIDTGVVAGHVTRASITPDWLAREMRQRRDAVASAFGVRRSA